VILVFFNFLISPDCQGADTYTSNTAKKHMNNVFVGCVISVIHPKYITESVNITKMMTVNIIKPTPAQTTQAGIGS